MRTRMEFQETGHIRFRLDLTSRGDAVMVVFLDRSV